MTEAIEPLAVDLGVDGYVNAVAEKGFTDATKDAVSSGIDNAKQDVKGKVEKAEEVAGFIQDDFNSLKENVSDFFASDEEKQKKKELCSLKNNKKYICSMQKNLICVIFFNWQYARECVTAN